MQDVIGEAELELQADRSARLRIPEGVELEVDPGGEPALNISSLHAIGLENLPDIAAHTIVRDAGGTTHQIEFIDGGWATVSFDENRKLRDFSAEGCGATLRPGGVLVLKRYNLPPER